MAADGWGGHKGRPYGEVGVSLKERVMRRFVVLCFLVMVGCTAALGVDRAKVDERLQRSAQVVREIMSAPDKGVPKDLLDKAVCVGVVPAEKKFAFGVGGSYGRGALVCRHGGTGAWAAPSMIIMSGGSFGFQIGGESTDVLFIVMNPDGARKLIQDSVKLGGDASVAGGPVGRTSAGATDSLSGAMVKQDKEGNKMLYGREISARDILLRSEVHAPATALPLDSTLDHHSPRGGQPWSE